MGQRHAVVGQHGQTQQSLTHLDLPGDLAVKWYDCKSAQISSSGKTHWPLSGSHNSLGPFMFSSFLSLKTGAYYSVENCNSNGLFARWSVNKLPGGW